MLSLSPLVIRAVNNPNLSPAARFTVQRWAELLDPHTHFNRSGYAIIEPVTLTDEVAQFVQDFLANRSFPTGELVNALNRLRDSIRLDGRLTEWYSADSSALNLFILDILTGIDLRKKYPHAHSGTAREFATDKAQLLVDHDLPAFRTILRDPATGYAAKLVADIADTFLPPLSQVSLTPDSWTILDDRLRLLAAVFLGEGRSGPNLVIQLAQAAGKAQSDERVSATLRQMVAADVVKYQVVVVVRGIRGVVKFPGFDCQVVQSADLPVRNHGRQQLVDTFVQKVGADACMISTVVSAWDADHARLLARAKVEKLIDYIGARFSRCELILDEAALVLRGNTHRVVPRRSRAPDTAFPLLNRPLAVLDGSLRYHSLSKGEADAVQSVLHSWVAVEQLASGHSQRATALLPDWLPSVLCLTALCNDLVGAWHLLKNSIGPSSKASAHWSVVRQAVKARNHDREIDKRGWAELVLSAFSTNPSADAAATGLRNLVASCPPLVQRRFYEVARYIERPLSLHEMSTKVFDHGQVNVMRMKSVRNRAVHGGMRHIECGRQLSKASCQIVDAVYEVLPPWLIGNTRTVDALERISERSNIVLDAWANGSSGPLPDFEALISPVSSPSAAPLTGMPPSAAVSTGSVAAPTPSLQGAPTVPAV